MDRNVGYGTDSHRTGHHLDRLHRKRVRTRDATTHAMSRQLDTVHTVVLEDLNTKAMTKSAKGTREPWP